ncbi:tetratricopeptide (TPR) repeat protein [Pseudomonas nitritireducens]|uniref:Tetratricopeptide (TPR) repeat protein n=1 Tax=Pseudomonas nitroreducens TaxID=46680 RepID=A0A7W7KNP6_PSENT|nr:tetratricopeptide repeat-containing glycosyltransferase family protein [Pseudomonas nitritireducens]MBB4866174.1 tetratricopeptide (TPR) repeat protein [Pseudomonas nitritireducens]
MSNHKLQSEIQRLSQALQIAEDREDRAEQIRLYEALAKLVPNTAMVHAKIARLHLELQDPQSAEPWAERALDMTTDPKVDEELLDTMRTHRLFIKNLERAERWYQASQSLPRLAMYCSALSLRKRFEEAEALYTQALEKPLEPWQQSILLGLLGTLYFECGRFHDSVACHQLTVELTPNYVYGPFNLALSLEQVARYQDAYRLYIQTLEKLPEHSGTHNNLSLLQLRLKQFDVAWPHYEARWKTSLKEHHQEFNTPRWRGEPLEGKTLLVWAEQGIGDHLMFASMLPDLLKLGGQVHVETYDRLYPLLHRSLPDLSIIQRESTGQVHNGQRMVHRQTWPRSDYQIPMGSLGEFLRPTLASFAGTRAFLKADPQQTQAKRAEYQRLFPGKRLVGISWRGGTDTANDMQSRRIEMQELAQLAKLDNVQLINLQYGNTEPERAEAESLGLHIHHDAAVNPLKDMDAQAAQLCALDAVLSIDNTTVHLAGALGVPTFVLLQLNPNWRWAVDDATSYWYPSVQLIRNRELGRWGEALDQAVQRMRGSGVL